jgi:hypothetical protein
MIPGADQDKSGSWIKDNGKIFVPTQSELTSDQARKWKGYGSALKPANEPICVARKPLDGTIVENVLAYGTGAINIDEGRIGDVEGRFPANIIHDGSNEVVDLFPNAPGQQGKVSGNEPTANGFSGAVKFSGMIGRIASSTPRVDSGSAARFFLLRESISV